MSANSLPTGQQRVSTNADEFNRMSFIVAQSARPPANVDRCKNCGMHERGGIVARWICGRFAVG